MPLDLTEYYARVASLKEDEPEEGYSIEAAGDAKAQGRRAAHHAARIRQAHEIAAAQEGAIELARDVAQAQLAEAEHALRQVARLRDEATRIDRALMREWMEHGRMWTEPDRPRLRSQTFGGFRLSSAEKTRSREKVVIHDEGAVMREWPELIVMERPRLDAKAAKAFLATVLGEQPGAIAATVATLEPARREIVYYIEMGSAKVALSTREDDDGNGADEHNTDGFAG